MVYTDATLSMVKCADHISHSAYLEIRRMSSIPFPNTHSADDESHCPADVFFCSQSVAVLQLSSLTSTVIRSTGCKKFKTMQRKLFFARVDMNTLDQGTSVAASERRDYFQDSHICFLCL